MATIKVTCKVTGNQAVSNIDLVAGQEIMIDEQYFTDGLFEKGWKSDAAEAAADDSGKKTARKAAQSEG